MASIAKKRKLKFQSELRSILKECPKGDEENESENESESDCDLENESVTRPETPPQIQSTASMWWTNPVIAVVVRGDITHRIYQVWATSLPKKFPSLSLKIQDKYDQNVSLIVADSSVTKESLLAWIGISCESINALSVPRFTIVQSNYVIQLIKSGALISPEQHQLHTLCYEDICSEKPPITPDSKADSEESNITPTQNPRRRAQQYACILTGNLQATSNPNKYLTDILEELQNVYELVHDEWRAMGYKKAIAIIKQFPKITDVTQLQGVKGIGSSIREKIHEILLTGKLKKISFFKSDKKIAALFALSLIWGVGERTASQFIRQGFTTIQDLQQRGMHLLTDQQKIGLKYYDEFQRKIPRQEVDDIVAVVQDHCRRSAPRSR